MTQEFWLHYGLPVSGLIFGSFGLLAAWIAARRFDRKYGAPQKQRR